MKDQILAYLILNEENINYRYVYVPNKVLFYFKYSDIIEFKQDKLEFEKMNSLIAKNYSGLIKKITVNNQKVQFLIDTGNRLQKIKTRFEKYGNSLMEFIERDRSSISED